MYVKLNRVFDMETRGSSFGILKSIRGIRTSIHTKHPLSTIYIVPRMTLRANAEYKFNEMRIDDLHPTKAVYKIADGTLTIGVPNSFRICLLN